MNSVHLHYKDRSGGGDYCKDHTKTHKHTMGANAVADWTYSCNWDSQIQLFFILPS